MMMNLEMLLEQITNGNRRALAKAITLIESNRNEDQEQAQKLLSTLPKLDRKTYRIGISGVPGVGKSTFIESLGMYLISKGKRVAVLAVDPSSPTTGGSILGDKTRMEQLSTKTEAFIRPSPTSGNLGGVARKSRESILLCEAAGYDIILVETVGVGQSEFEVASMTDCFMVMMLPGAGDSLQGIKRGILEITDILVINKADGDLKNLAKIAAQEYQNAFHLIKPKYEGIQTDILTCSALENSGIPAVWDAVEKFFHLLIQTHRFEKNREQQQLSWFRKLAEELWLKQLWASSASLEIRSSLLAGKITPVQAAYQLTQQFISY